MIARITATIQMPREKVLSSLLRSMSQKRMVSMEQTTMPTSAAMLRPSGTETSDLNMPAKMIRARSEVSVDFLKVDRTALMD